MSSIPRHFAKTLIKNIEESLQETIEDQLEELEEDFEARILEIEQDFEERSDRLETIIAEQENRIEELEECLDDNQYQTLCWLRELIEANPAFALTSKYNEVRELAREIVKERKFDEAL